MRWELPFKGHWKWVPLLMLVAWAALFALTWAGYRNCPGDNCWGYPITFAEACEKALPLGVAIACGLVGMVVLMGLRSSNR